jgi:hypothetical protein
MKKELKDKKLVKKIVASLLKKGETIKALAILNLITN